MITHMLLHDTSHCIRRILLKLIPIMATNLLIQNNLALKVAILECSQKYEPHFSVDAIKTNLRNSSYFMADDLHDCHDHHRASHLEKRFQRRTRGGFF